MGHPLHAGHSPRLQIVLLAAGFSSRLGTPKAFARVRGETLLHRTVRMLLPLAFRTILIVVPPRFNRYRAETIRQHDGLRGGARRPGAGTTSNLVANPRRAGGIATSVQRGLRGSRCASAVLFVPVDLPRLAPRDLTRLVARWRANRRRVVARKIDRHGGIPLILPRWLYGRAMQIEGDGGLKDLIRELPPDRSCFIPMPSAEWDVDTSADLAAARRPRAPVPTAFRSLHPYP